MSLVALSLGSNLGSREENLRKAIEKLKLLGSVIKVSPVYETEPYGYFDQPKFLNCAVLLETNLKPDELLNKIKSIERELGRKEATHWKERIIDIDIVLLEDLIMETPPLTIPHPDMQYREFVLKPLSDIAPEMVHPVLKKNIKELLLELNRVPYVDFVNAKPGNFYIAVLDGKVYETSFRELKGKRDKNGLLLSLKKSFENYFQGNRVTFEEYELCWERVPAFHRKVYEYLRKNVTYGKVITYGELAQMVGAPRGARAVGNAMARNPFPIIVPCHRVLQKGNKLGGFGGGEEWKKYLLELEGINI